MIGTSCGGIPPPAACVVRWPVHYHNHILDAPKKKKKKKKKRVREEKKNPAAIPTRTPLLTPTPLNIYTRSCSGSSLSFSLAARRISSRPPRAWCVCLFPSPSSQHTSIFFSWIFLLLLFFSCLPSLSIRLPRLFLEIQFTFYEPIFFFS